MESRSGVRQVQRHSTLRARNAERPGVVLAADFQAAVRVSAMLATCCDRGELEVAGLIRISVARVEVLERQDRLAMVRMVGRRQPVQVRPGVELPGVVGPPILERVPHQVRVVRVPLVASRIVVSGGRITAVGVVDLERRA